MAWTKIGNRYYDVVDGLLKKSTYDSDSDSYVECGSWQSDTFSGLGESDMDSNTWIERSNIISEFDL